MHKTVIIIFDIVYLYTISCIWRTKSLSWFLTLWFWSFTSSFLTSGFFRNQGSELQYQSSKLWFQSTPILEYSDIWGIYSDLNTGYNRCSDIAVHNYEIDGTYLRYCSPDRILYRRSQNDLWEPMTSNDIWGAYCSHYWRRTAISEFFFNVGNSDIGAFPQFIVISYLGAKKLITRKKGHHWSAFKLGPGSDLILSGSGFHWGKCLWWE